MDQAAIPQGQPGRNGHARARCESRERLVNRIARIPQPEAGWDRTSPQWAFLSRLRIADVPLDAGHANAAAAIHEQTQVSVADAHIGAALQSAPNADVTVITSDQGDIRRVAGDRSVTVVAI